MLRDPKRSTLGASPFFDRERSVPKLIGDNFLKPDQRDLPVICKTAEVGSSTTFAFGTS